MRILQVIESFGAGSMRIALTISERLAADGHQLAIAHGRVPESPDDPRSVVSDRVELFALRWPRTPLGQLSAARQLRRLVRDWEPDLVHLHSSFAGALGSVVLRGRAPLIYTPHAYSFMRHGRSVLAPAAFRMLERVIARRVELVGAVSDSEAELARAQLRAPRVVVVPNGIPELDDPPAPAPERTEPQLVVSVGRVVPQRQPAATARILAALADLATLEWIGGAGDSDGGAAALRAAGVSVTGWLDHARALERLSCATACLHWSAWDAQPVTVLEAMALDVVVIASDIPANRELLGPLQVCGSEQAASELLRSVLTDAGKRAQLLAQQRARRGRYSAARMVADWLEVYRRVCASEVPQPAHVR
jgi:glycosyltransferase involved in cell wall biosynthesis